MSKLTENKPGGHEPDQGAAHDQGVAAAADDLAWLVPSAEVAGDAVEGIGRGW